MPGLSGRSICWRIFRGSVRVWTILRPGTGGFGSRRIIVFYTEDRDGVVIRAIMHHSREIRPDLFD